MKAWSWKTKVRTPNTATKAAVTSGITAILRVAVHDTASETAVAAITAPVAQ